MIQMDSDTQKEIKIQKYYKENNYYNRETIPYRLLIIIQFTTLILW